MFVQCYTWIENESRGGYLSAIQYVSWSLGFVRTEMMAGCAWLAVL